ncbi:MAG: SprB repeat-containing protein [Chryseolinea sp.]
MRKLLLLGLIINCFSCSEDPEPIDCEIAGPILSLGLATSATSCSIADGTLNVSASGGKQPYTFTLNDNAGQADGQFNNLHAGIYRVIVTDANGCAKSVDNVSIKASDFSFTANITADNSCLSGNGQIEINVTQVNPPYLYKLGTGDFSEDNSFPGLSVGTYGFVVKDNNDCSIFLNLTVPRGFTGVSWTDDIRPIITKSCTLSGCHDGKTRIDLSVFGNAKTHAENIKSKTQDRSMPREGTLSQSEIDIIACWVDDGAVLN